MNLKSILVLIVMLIWWIVCWKHYTCGIKNFCDSEYTRMVDSSQFQAPSFPISFNINSDSAILNDFEIYRSDLCSKYNGQYIEIVGSYFSDEINSSSFANIGLARAQQFKNLLASCIDTSKIQLASIEITKDSLFKSPFEALKIQIADTTRFLNLSEIKVVSQDNMAELFFPLHSKISLKEETYSNILKEYIAKIGVSSQKIRLEGHFVNNLNSEATNKTLSEDRCKMVKNHLISMGLSEDKIVIEGYGSSKPKYVNNTPENIAKNCRITIKIIQ
jgi:OOP family OmpA-OmpF porin